MTPPQGDGVILFGEFRFDPSSGDVWADGNRIARLQEQPRLVLATLLSRPNALVSRDELCRLLWPDDTLVLEEIGLLPYLANSPLTIAPFPAPIRH
jgi:DNA-binding winged helix-turn-helix (wHTH) protein